MNKLAKQAALSLYEKYAAEDDGRAYRLSRAYKTMTDLGTYGLYSTIHQRGTQGRANLSGDKGFATKSEKVYRKAIEDPNSEKTYPISRAFTSPAVLGGLGAVTGAAGAKAMGRGKMMIPAALLGAASSAASTMWNRDIFSRASIGQSNVGREGILPLKKKQLKAMKGKDLDNSRAIRREMDSDTTKAVGAMLGSSIARPLVV